MKIKILLFISILSLWLVLPLQTQADTSIPFSTSGNVFAFDSPYVVTFTYDYGPQNDQLQISISGNFSNVKDVFLTGIPNILPLSGRAVTYTSGTGQFARIENTTFQSKYDTWYDVMVLSPTITGTLEIYFFPIFNQGLTQAQLTTIITNNMAINFNSIPNFSDYFDSYYDAGYERGSQDYGIVDGDDFLTADEWGVLQYNIGYSNGLDQGPENTLAIRNMIPGILGVTFAFFFQLASISFLGISALDLIGAVITITTVIFIIRIYLNR
jgi:hypothetical protein